MNLSEAVRKGNIDRIKEIIADKNVNPLHERYWKMKLDSAITKKDIEIIRVLLSSEYEFKTPHTGHEYCWFTFLKNAVSHQKYELVKMLLNHPRIDPGEQRSKALQLAVIGENYKMVELLLSHPKINPGDRDNEIIDNAVRGKSKKIMKLIFADPRVTPTRHTLYHAISKGDIEAINIILTYPNINVASHYNGLHNYYLSENKYNKIKKILESDPRHRKNSE